jgi:hypothetical protein
MKAYNTLWWIAARHWSEIAFFSPLVISQRMLAAMQRPSVRQQAEMTRMVVEKGEAAAESAAALWLSALQSNQLAWQRAWLAGRVAPAPADFALTAASARRLGGALRPISRRVGANARRLSAPKRRKK